MKCMLKNILLTMTVLGLLVACGGKEPEAKKPTAPGAGEGFSDAGAGKKGPTKDGLTYIRNGVGGSGGGSTGNVILVINPNGGVDFPTGYDKTGVTVDLVVTDSKGNVVAKKENIPAADLPKESKALTDGLKDGNYSITATGKKGGAEVFKFPYYYVVGKKVEGGNSEDGLKGFDLLVNDENGEMSLTPVGRNTEDDVTTYTYDLSIFDKDKNEVVTKDDQAFDDLFPLTSKDVDDELTGQPDGMYKVKVTAADEEGNELGAAEFLHPKVTAGAGGGGGGSGNGEPKFITPPTIVSDGQPVTKLTLDLGALPAPADTVYKWKVKDPATGTYKDAGEGKELPVTAGDVGKTYQATAILNDAAKTELPTKEFTLGVDDKKNSPMNGDYIPTTWFDQSSFAKAEAISGASVPDLKREEIITNITYKDDATKKEISKFSLTVFYPYGSDDLLAQAQASMLAIKDIEATFPSYVAIVEGYASKAGSDTKNDDYGHDRAITAKDQLINIYGIKKETIVMLVGHGERHAKGVGSKTNRLDKLDQKATITLVHRDLLKFTDADKKVIDKDALYQIIAQQNGCAAAGCQTHFPIDEAKRMK